MHRHHLPSANSKFRAGDLEVTCRGHRPYLENGSTNLLGTSVNMLRSGWPIRTSGFRVPTTGHSRTFSDKSGFLARAAYPRTRNGLWGVSERVSMQLDTTGVWNRTHWDTGGFPDIHLTDFWISKFFEMPMEKLNSAGYISHPPDTLGHFQRRAGF
jgi:hypothetical protein